MAQTQLICIERGSSTRFNLKIGRIGGWNEDSGVLATLFKIRVNGNEITCDNGNMVYDAGSVNQSPFLPLTHYAYFTVPSGVNDGTLLYKDNTGDTTFTELSFTVGSSISQIYSSTPHRYIVEPKNADNYRLFPSSGLAVLGESGGLTQNDISFSLIALGNNEYRLQHVTTGLCLSSGGGAESVGQQCTFVALSANDNTQKLTGLAYGPGGVILRFVSNPSRSPVMSNDNRLILAEHSGSSSAQSFLLVSITDSRSVGGGGGSLAAPVVDISFATSDSMTLDWADIGGATNYVVQRSSSLNGTYSTVGNPTVSNYTDTGLSAATQYYYRVKANDGTNDSAYSNIASGTTAQSGGSNTGTPTISLNNQNTVWTRQDRLIGTAAANSTVTIRDGSTTIAIVTANSIGLWTYLLSSALPLTNALNAIAQIAGFNASTPTANISTSVAPINAYWLAVLTNGTAFRVEEVDVSSGGTATRKSTPVVISSTERSSAALSLTDLHTALN